MFRALLESRKALAHSSPNPHVGAVVVKNNKIVGRGHTQVPGRAHAEVMALRDARGRSQGGSLYVTLEPCCHFGRTPPCTELIARSGIKEVFTGLADPNPLVCGRGAAFLKNRGITVRTGILKNKIARELQWYLKFITKKIPYVTLKAGCSLDARITDETHHSRWITSAAARERSRNLRMENDGILAGIGTVAADDPLLTLRAPGAQKPLFYRIILDASGRIDPASRVLKSVPCHRTLIAAGVSASRSRLKWLQRMKDAELVVCRTKQGRIDLPDLLSKLAEKSIARIIVEGGSEVYSSFLKQNLVDKVVLFMAPLFLGGAQSKGLFSASGFSLKAPLRIREGRFYNRLIDNYIYEGYLNVYRPD